jgi:two-component system OmpR family sensor kinase
MLEHIQEGFEARTLAEQRLRQFIADASHELRTPLSSIRGYAELFRRGAGAHPDDVAIAMRRIEEEGEQMSALVDDLLLLARLDQGRPLAREPVDLAALCADAAADSRVIDARWPVILDVPADPLVVTGDQLRLRQVLGNLVRNARVHTPPETIITISLACLDIEKAAVLTVSDNGPGVPPEALPHVFDRFYRADASRSRTSGGSGLGLSIVQAIVDAHGGCVNITSVPGATTVELHLPLAESPNGRSSQPVHSASSEMLQHPERR